MAKRKRQAAVESEPAQKPKGSKKLKPGNGSPQPKTQQAKKTRTPKLAEASTGSSTTTDKTTPQRTGSPMTIQIIAGSYDRVLHGVTATVQPSSQVHFADSFLFNAHTSAIRCLALSPPSAPVPGQSQKVMLATGSTDERINVYNLSAHPPSAKASTDQELLSTIARRPILENSKNRELGTLMHHSSTVTRLSFPTRSKLLSSSEDSTIAVTRVRDWSLLSTIKAPVPAVTGRPSGDTAPMGGTPSGVNDFAVHPSMKVMISVSKGERCMRLWNLVTGKKAGVLDFGRAVLQEIGEGRHSTGEGRKVVWGTSGESGDEFAVGFDRDVLVFGMDSKVRCRVMPDARTKIHQFDYVRLGDDSEDTVFAVSTEDGRVLFLSTKAEDLEQAEAPEGKAAPLPRAKLLAQVGGKDAGVTGRVKDFKVMQSDAAPGVWFIVSASSDGKLRVWELASEELRPKAGKEAPRAGKLLGTHDTQNRITCVEAFVMIPRPEGVEESEDELQEEDEEDGGDSSDE
ncbi:putative wd domain-containing protein [Diaporthe ampelina]|uniref:Putative wd domain-containing protein n=1 Tax=Diaporthe ampelina TaxID=1214573 RepID=A0A0G2IFI1_9PEZI|nr:putative wd domain-containing protein [Diaporthe ampelina]